MFDHPRINKSIFARPMTKNKTLVENSEMSCQLNAGPFHSRETEQQYPQSHLTGCLLFVRPYMLPVITWNYADRRVDSRRGFETKTDDNNTGFPANFAQFRSRIMTFVVGVLCCYLVVVLWRAESRPSINEYVGHLNNPMFRYRFAQTIRNTCTD